MRFALVFFCLLFLAFASACSSSGESSSPVRLPAGGFSPRAVSGQDLSPASRIPLTAQASELRRVRDEHSSLIASMPATPSPTSTLTVAERSRVATARVRRYPDGVPAPPPVGSDWFDPAVGIDFYRESGGDWTARLVRESHPHRDLFYFSGYPQSVPHFSDRSIYPHLSRELVFEAVSVLPLLGEATPAMVRAFSRHLGWELRNAPAPVVNLWTTFTVQRAGRVHVYAVGGVMRMGVSSLGEGDSLLEYVTPGSWVGPVVVERLR